MARLFNADLLLPVAIFYGEACSLRCVFTAGANLFWEELVGGDRLKY